MNKIMFNDKYQLTKAVLEGRKTMTRRLVPERVIVDGKIYAFRFEDPSEALRQYILRKAPYKVGQIVAISQSYKQIEEEIERQGLPLYLIELKRKCAAYRNKMFVRTEDMPHHIKITNIKAELVQDISDDDCYKEGIYSLKDTVHRPLTVYTFIGGDIFDTPQTAFRSLFAKTTRKPELWDRNEWVYVYEFELED